MHYMCRKLHVERQEREKSGYFPTALVPGGRINYVVYYIVRWSRWFWRVQAVGRYALDHFVPVVLVGTLAERHVPADPFGRIGYID